jgi:hypothetical protein
MGLLPLREEDRGIEAEGEAAKAAIHCFSFAVPVSVQMPATCCVLYAINSIDG